MTPITTKEPLPEAYSVNRKYDFSGMKVGECQRYPIPEDRDPNWMQRMLCRCFRSYIVRHGLNWKYATRRLMKNGQVFIGVWRVA